MLYDYTVLLTSPLSLATYGVLALAIISLWVKPSFWVWGSLLALSILLGLAAHRLQWFALLFIFFFGTITYFTLRKEEDSPTQYKTKLKILKISGGILVFISSCLLLLHKIPGFSNWLIAKEMVLSKNAIPFNLYLNFGKPLIGLFILGFGTIPLLKNRSTSRLAFKRAAPIAFIGIMALMGLSLSMGYVNFDLKFNNFFFIWAFNNLIFVCVAEEVLFRGFLQHYLAVYFKQIRYGDLLALLLASVLFGLAHFSGGVSYMILAFCAGSVYGFIYLKTKRIEASIFTHFLLNTLHFLAFTYPALVKPLP
jgi:hypothetical protein